MPSSPFSCRGATAKKGQGGRSAHVPSKSTLSPHVTRQQTRPTCLLQHRLASYVSHDALAASHDGNVCMISGCPPCYKLGYKEIS